MKFDTAAGTNPIDQGKVIDQPVDRYEGRLKTIGTATDAYEHHAAAPDAAYGYILGGAVPKGRIAAIELREARSSPGVRAIVTAENAGPLDRGEFYVTRALAGPNVDHCHQAVAIVVADTFEEARAAAQLVHVEYGRTPGSFDLAAAKDGALPPQPAPYTPPAETGIGDFDTAFAAAPVQLDAVYSGGRREAATASTRMLDAGAHRMTRLRLAVLDLPEGAAMRAAGEAPAVCGCATTRSRWTSCSTGYPRPTEMNMHANTHTNLHANMHANARPRRMSNAALAGCRIAGCCVAAASKSA